MSEEKEHDKKELLKRGYQVLDIAGQGRFGVVYIVYSEKFKQKFAAKVVDDIKGLDSEAECLSICLSPHIIKLYDFFTFDNKSCIILEYCSNGTVNNLIAKLGKLTCDQVLQILYYLLEAIKDCHEKSIAHRDIKPANILIDEYGKLRLSDFGLSKRCEGMFQKITSTSGSTCFMAPEIFGKTPYDPFKADVWAIGITAFMLMYGQYPWIAKNKESMIEEIKKGFSHPLKYKKGEMMDMINMCLHLDPEKRPTVEELLKLPMFQRDIPKDGLVMRRKPKIFSSTILSRVPRRICSKGNLQIALFSTPKPCFESFRSQKSNQVVL